MYSILMEKDKAKVSPYIKSLVTGSSIIGEMTLGGLFMENLKMEKQRTSKPYPLLAKKVLGQGIKGFEAGLLPWGVTIGWSKGLSLGWAHATLKNKGNEYNLSPTANLYVSGFGAGAFQGCCVAPLMLARTRVNEQVSTRSTTESWRKEIKMSSKVLSNVIKKEGLYSMCNGMGITVLRRSLDWGLRFGIKNNLDTQLNKYTEVKDTSVVNMGTSFASGAVASLISNPLDRMLPIIQSSHGYNAFTILKQKIATEGIGTLFRGYGMRALDTGWHTMFAIFVADVIYKSITDI